MDKSDLETQIKVYIKKRGICKSKLTNFSKFVRKLQDEVSSTSYEVNTAKAAELETRLHTVTQVLAEFEEYQQFLEENHDKPDEQLTEREVFENNYYEIVGIAKAILQKLVRLDNLGVGNTSHVGGVNNSFLAPRAHPNLPSIPIPKFSGSYEKWLEFRDIFISLIHSNNELSNIEKFYFLRGALEGDAKEIVQSLEMSASNYTVAWDLVCERYNNDTMLVNNHLKLLFDLPKLDTESAANLRKLLDGVTKHIRSLATLGLPTDTWDVIIIFIIVGKLDNLTKRAWEENKRKDKLPTLDEFKSFLKSRAETLEAVEDKGKRRFVKKSFLGISQGCAYCNKEHFIADCSDFLKMPVYMRYEHLKKLKLCLNCLKRNHYSRDCTVSGCIKCSSKHHALLHFDKRKNGKATEVGANQGKSSEGQSVTMCVSEVGCSDEVLLSTALVNLRGPTGKCAVCRVLLDCGSQSNLIVSDMCGKLDLEVQPVDIALTGINQCKSVISKKCYVKIQSLHNPFEQDISCLVVSKLTDAIPSHKINVSNLDIPKNLRLADPNFSNPGPIDLILGIDVFYHLLCIGQIKLGDNLPFLQKTRIGWVVGGSLAGNYYKNRSVHCNFVSTMDIQSQLSKFWSLEEPPSNIKNPFSWEEQECEKIFVETTKRDTCGKFIVRIPLKAAPSELGDSRKHALNRFYSLERNLAKQNKFSDMYKEFMSEYERLGHMSRDPDPNSEGSYFMPHHGVLNESSTTTKLRVVFNGSASTDTGLSVNSIQCIGPTIQDNLMAILLRFRQNDVIVCSDIEKMYRMVWVDESQRCLQKIFWRDNPDKKLNVYTLNTVTYGTSSAAYLAIRCLHQLGLENIESFPEASRVILKDFYVDDMLTSFSSKEEAVRVCSDVSKILSSGGFNLRKWLSNEPEVLERLSHDSAPDRVFFDKEGENKTLGLYWSYENDLLRFHISPNMSSKVTKRTVLSEIAKIFDPLSLLSPSIILAKIILQKLWSEKLDWDQSLPLSINSSWLKFRDNLIQLNKVCIPRQVTCKRSVENQLHGFCDASIEAYGAAVYLRSINSENEVTVRLIYSKAKVAPLKVITLPRLELCGALVLAQLINKLKSSWDLNISKTFLWSDSTVVLSWLATTPNTLQTFIANRVSQIQSLTTVRDWNHVKSEHNPSDLLTRGVQPSNIIDNQFWWNGPGWLKHSEDNWPESNFQIPSELPEVKKKVICHFSQHDVIFPFVRFSSFVRMKRCFAWCLRFINNCRPGMPKITDPLSVEEINKALDLLVLFAQQESFPHEINLLASNNVVMKGPMLRLNPFLAADGSLRVGGRIQLSELDYEKKHPRILSSQHPLTKMLFRHEHVRLVHAGPQLLLASIRENFWVIRGRNLAKKVVHECVRCFRAKPKEANQIMGILPEMRVRPMPPFNTCGIDYAGPFLIKDKQGRGAKLMKCYIALFVCFSTKAQHLELVSDLTTEAFIAAFRRFAARRGCPAYVYSDNATNFQGANSELRELGEFLQKEQGSLLDVFEGEGIVWRFIPAHSPNFGGLWEAGVKSCKYHLKRVMSNAYLTFEQFTTLLTQVEAVLNSRPLVPLSSDPNDFDVLTPAHFLIGRRLTSVPDPNVLDIKESRLSKFQRVQQLQQHFWSRWSKEYIAELQQRSKWPLEQSNLDVGQLVVVKEDHLPPMKWRLGRIVEIFPGPDSKCRVASVKTKNSIFKRPVSKLCPLPVSE